MTNADASFTGIKTIWLSRYFFYHPKFDAEKLWADASFTGIKTVSLN
ncbi:MAG: hypothetical protein V5804_02885 [Mucilaginibacter sp.]